MAATPAAVIAAHPAALDRLRRSLVLAAVGASLAVVCAGLAVLAPPLLRLAGYVAVSSVLVALAFLRPRAAVTTSMAFLVVLALVRRLLIDEFGWLSADPLLLVGATVAAVLLVRLLVLARRPVAPDLVSLLVLAVLLLSVVQVANPTGASVGANVAALLFVAVPLLWFFIGRELAPQGLAPRVLDLLLVAGVLVALYGLWQSQVGLPPWDRAWVEVNGYDALRIGDRVRPFGTFSSSAEYAIFLGSALAVAAARVAQGRTVAVLAVPPLVLALFLASARAALLTAVLAVLVVLGMRLRRPLAAAAVVLVGGALAYGAITVLGGQLASSSNSLVVHQVSGLSDPLDPRDSTLLLHVELVVDGVTWAARNPLGGGTGAANLGHGGEDGDVRGTEVDLSNAFVNLGLPGGVLYLALVLLVLWRTVAGYFAGVEVMLPITGVLVAGIGQWLTGGHYALSPLTWLLIGVAAAEAAALRRPAPRAAPA